MLKALTVIANKLDRLGMHKEADLIDSVLKKESAYGAWVPPEKRKERDLRMKEISDPFIRFIKSLAIVKSIPEPQSFDDYFEFISDLGFSEDKSKEFALLASRDELGTDEVPLQKEYKDEERFDPGQSFQSQEVVTDEDTVEMEVPKPQTLEWYDETENL